MIPLADNLSCFDGDCNVDDDDDTVEDVEFKASSSNQAQLCLGAFGLFTPGGPKNQYLSGQHSTRPLSFQVNSVEDISTPGFEAKYSWHKGHVSKQEGENRKGGEKEEK